MKPAGIAACLLCLLAAGSARAQEERAAAEQRTQLFKDLSREMAPGKTIQLEALEIRAKIYEPQVIYILDRAKVDVEFREEELSFGSRIAEPVVENRL